MLGCEEGMLEVKNVMEVEGMKVSGGQGCLAGSV